MSETLKIRQTLDNIAECLDSLKNNVDSIDDLIKSDSIINQNIISNTMEGMLKLKSFQDSLKKEYSKIFPESKCSDLLNNVISEIESYESQLEEKKLLNKARYIIIKFNSIRSNVEECQKCLNEYSSQLEIINNKDIKLDDYLKAVKPYEEFYEIVDNESQTDKIAYTMKETIFSSNSKLLLYLIQNQLFIDKSMLENQDEFIESDINKLHQLSFENSSSANNLHEIIDSEPGKDSIPLNDESKKTNTDIVPEPITIETIIADETTDKNPKPEETESFFENTNETIDPLTPEVINFKSFGIAIRKRDEYTNITVEDYDDGKKVSNKTFKKDVEKFKKGNGFVLYTFKKVMYFNELLLQKRYSFHGKNQLECTNMLNSLLKLGYLRKDIIDGFEPIYGITNKTLTCLNEKSNLDWFKFFNSSSKNIWPLENTEIMSVDEEKNANIILTRIGYCIIECLINNAFPQGICGSTVTLAEYCYLAFYTFGAHQTTFFVLSCFLPEENSIQSFIDIFDSKLSDFSCEEIEFSILVSDNLNECTSLMNYFRSKDNKFSNTRFYCYSIEEKKYYNIISQEEIVYDELIETIVTYHKSKYKSANKAKELINKSIDTQNDNTNEEIITKTKSDTELITKEEVAETLSVINEISVTEATDTNSDKTDDTVLYEDGPDINFSIDYSIYHNQNISDEEIMNNIYSMINSEKAYCASAYLGVVSTESKYSNLKNELSFALNTPDKKGIYLSDVVMNIFDDFESIPGVFSDCLEVCAQMRVLFYNTSHHDYNYKQMYSVMKSLEPINSNPALADFAYNLEEFKASNDMGIDAVADYRLKENLLHEKIINDISKEANELYEKYIIHPVKERCALPRYVDMKKMIFKETNQLSECLKIVADNSSDEIYFEYVHDFIISNFIDENIEIRSENFKKQTIDNYVDSFWSKAGKIQRDKQQSTKLVSSLRNNILNSVNKIVSIICDWYYHTLNSKNSSSLKGYEKNKNIIKSALNKAILCTKQRIDEYHDNAELRAGYNCIILTLSEFDSRMNGNYNENSVKYYYIDFLKHGDVMLDENYLPDFSGHNIAINNFTPTDCIIRHSIRPDKSFEKRIDEIFYRLPSSIDDNLGDDYGCAQLIKNYFNDYGTEWDEEKNNIEANTDEAIKQFKSNFENFKGSLELSQSYGQIDNDRKEQILSMVNNQYMIIERTHNFGYFSRLISYVEETIKHEAKIREKTLKINLDTVASEYESSERAEPFIKEAREMLERQNYTVTEDLIHRIQNNDFDNTDTIIDEDNFLEFIQEYSSNYKTVSDPSRNLKKIIQSSKRPMKDTKRGTSLIDNFPSGCHQSPDKIKNLLSILGFPVDKVSVDTTNQKTYDSYSVELIKNTNGKKENYTHPIAPFGSLAEENGFRVICLFGMFDARRLLDKFKEIGTTRHTIVILDYALNAPERRTLARKIKEEISDKVFIVVDRVAIFYLANHYTENTINRILMEITMPYSSFQPYSVDSARPIPVEMFMGRKDQLENIESPTGANIICGGRQLGKSALLRMAKSDIDNNENGDRAIYVEIKDCNCEKAAKKISAALVDEDILPDGSETSDWSELARAIKKRLNSKTENKIPYLLLLIDEADAFIEDCKNYKYAPLDDLEDIQSVGVNRFKFVVAGLRNLVKFEKEKSTSNNSGIAHLSQKTIRPFTYKEACELLEKPLHYLGIRFPKNQSYLVSLILASTNYFPGLIHFYCAKLIEAVKKYDPVFDENSSPPYEVTEAHIKRVLADPEFSKQIKDKFEITLKLDTDNFYHIIVVLMAYCHYTTVSSDGYSSEEIYNTANDYDISKIQKLQIDKLTALMDELCELNILRKNQNGKYQFARYNFLQLLGTSGEIEDMILKYSSEEV